MTDAGLAVPGGGVRYPNALIAPFDDRGSSTPVPDPVTIIEVQRPSATMLDKLVLRPDVGSPDRGPCAGRAGHAHPPYRHRSTPDQGWLANGLTLGDTLDLPEIGAIVSAADLFASLYLDPPVPDPRKTPSAG